MRPALPACPPATAPNVPAAFPAYSDPTTSRLTEVKDSTTTVPKLCAKIHIMHPDENISLVNILLYFYTFLLKNS